LDKVGGVILAAGRGERMGAPLNKAFLPLGDRPLLLHSIITFEAASVVDAYVVVAPPDEVAFCRVLLAPYGLQKLMAVAPGGGVRQSSAAAGVRALPDFDLVAVHDAARPLLSVGLLEGAVRRAAAAGCPGALVVAVPVKDTVKVVDSSGMVRETPARDGLWIAQTPQVFRRDLLLRAYDEAERSGFAGTDDASLVERLGVPVEIFQGSYDNFKVTTPEDLRIARAILEAKGTSPCFQGGASVRVGIGYDVHPFEAGRPLMLGGVEIPAGPGLAGHSDADAALHALMDACLGAAGLRDIGHLFPPGDPQWKDAPSLALLAGVRSKLADAGYTICQVDLVIAAETPRLAPYMDSMQQRIAALQGIAAWAVANIRRL
jgi:2-C-methyl-D-erythritol 4-phosphate cytidylyltransferase/2-C-methyl-D-erythritol 2,4-cyclodiphosphate synthase